MLVKFVVLPSVLFVALLGMACGDQAPSAPSPTPTPVVSTTPVPLPDLSRILGVWDLAVRVTSVTGTGCVAETMRSQIGVPQRYSLSVTQLSSVAKVEVTLRSASGNYACTFEPVADSTGFTTYGKPGFYRCEHDMLDFRCTDGTMHSIFSFGEDISGHVSGTELAGTWDAAWFRATDQSGVEMKAQFTGRR